MNGIKEYLEKGIIAMNEKIINDEKLSKNASKKQREEFEKKIKKSQEKITELNLYLSEVKCLESQFQKICFEKEKNEEDLAISNGKIKGLEKTLEIERVSLDNLRDFRIKAVQEKTAQKKEIDSLTEELRSVNKELSNKKTLISRYKERLHNLSSPIISPASSIIIEEGEKKNNLSFLSVNGISRDKEIDENHEILMQESSEDFDKSISEINFLIEEIDDIVNNYAEQFEKTMEDYPEITDEKKEKICGYFVYFQKLIKTGMEVFHNQQVGSLHQKLGELEKKISNLSNMLLQKDDEIHQSGEANNKLRIKVAKLESADRVNNKVNESREKREAELRVCIEKKNQELKEWEQKHKELLSNNSNLLLQFFSANNELEELKKFLDITYQEEQKNHISLLKNFQENSRQEVSDIFDTTNALQIIKEKFESLSPLSSAAPVFSNINETIGKIDEGLEEGWRLLEDSQTVFAGYAGQNQKEISDEWKEFLKLMRWGIQITISHYRASLSGVNFIVDLKEAKDQKEQITAKAINDLMILISEEFGRIREEWKEEKEKEIFPVVSEKENFENQLKSVEESYGKLQKSYEELEEEKKKLNETFKKITEENVEKEKLIEELQEKTQILSEEKETKTKELVKKLEDLKKTKEKEIEEKINEVKKESDEKIVGLKNQVKTLQQKKVELEKRTNGQKFLIEGDSGYLRQIEELEKCLEGVNHYNIELKERIDELIQDKVDEEKYSKNDNNIHSKESSSSSDLANNTLFEELGSKIYSSPSSSPTKESPTITYNNRKKSFSFSQRNRSSSVISVASIATISSFDSSYDSLTSSLDKLKEKVRELWREKKVLLKFLEVESFETLREKLSGKKLGEWLEELENSRNEIKKLELELELSRRELERIKSEQKLTMQNSLLIPAKSSSSPLQKTNRRSSFTIVNNFASLLGVSPKSPSSSGRSNYDSFPSSPPRFSDTPFTVDSSGGYLSDYELSEDERKKLQNKIKELELANNVLQGKLENKVREEVFDWQENIQTNLANNDNKNSEKKLVQKLINDLELELSQDSSLNEVIEFIKNLLRSPITNEANEEIKDELEDVKSEIERVGVELDFTRKEKDELKESLDEKTSQFNILDKQAREFLSSLRKAENELIKLKDNFQQKDILVNKIEVS